MLNRNKGLFFIVSVKLKIMLFNLKKNEKKKKKRGYIKKLSWYDWWLDNKILGNDVDRKVGPWGDIEENI